MDPFRSDVDITQANIHKKNRNGGRDKQEPRYLSRLT